MAEELKNELGNEKSEIVEAPIPLKTRTKAFLWTIVILLLLLFFGIFLVVRHYKSKNTAKSTLIEVDKIYFESLKEDSRRVVDLTGKLLDLREELKNTQSALKLSTEQTVILQYELDKCLGKKAVRNTGNTGKNNIPPPPPRKGSSDLVEKEAFRPPSNTSNSTALNPPPVRTGGNTGSGMLSIDKYSPVYEGDFCTTVQMGYLVYALSDSYWQKCTQKTISTPTINGVAMNLDASSGYWILISGTILTPEVIVKEKFRWSISIGEFVGSGFRYDMYLPHESVKSIMRLVLNREDGQVTAAELGSMGQQDENIRRGLVGQNLNSVAASDGKTYYGWEFITPVNYTVKTN